MEVNMSYTVYRNTGINLFKWLGSPSEEGEICGFDCDLRRNKHEVGKMCFEIEYDDERHMTLRHMLPCSDYISAICHAVSARLSAV